MMINQPETYDQEWYDYIDELVLKYQSGDSEAAGELIASFEPYLNKYYLLITRGRINFNDKDTRSFLMLYIPDKDINRSLRRSRQSSEVRAEARKALNRLQSNCRSIPEEDLRQELVLCLLILADRYKKKGKKNFTGYLYNAFRYELMRRIQTITKDPVSFSTENNVSYNDESNITLYEADLNFVDSSELPLIPGEEFGINWIHGATTSELFASLTTFERLILKLYYVDELYDYEIAEKTGYHRSWIIRKRHNIIKELARSLGYDTEDD